MDHSYGTAQPFTPLPPQIAATGASIVSFLHSGGRSVMLLGPAGSGKTTTLDAVLSGMPAWVERVSNRIPQPLSVARILSQLGAEPEANPRAALLRVLSERTSPDQPAVLAIDDAHSLTEEAFALVSEVPGSGGPDLPGMVLILAGEPSLLALARKARNTRRRGPRMLTLRMPDAGVLIPGLADRDPRHKSLVWRAPPTNPRAYQASQPAEESQPARLGITPTVEASEPRRHPLWAYVAAGLGVTCIATSLLLQPLDPSPAPLDAAAREPDPPTVVMAGEAEQAPVPPPAVPTQELREAMPRSPVGEPAPELPPLTQQRPITNETQLRRDFDLFLNRAGRDTAQLSASARESLFREYRVWRARAAP